MEDLGYEQTPINKNEYPRSNGLTEDDDDDPNVFFDLEEDMYRVLKRDAWLIFYYSPRNIPLINRFKLFEYVWIMPYIFHGEPTARNPFGTKMSYSIVVVMRKGRPKVKRRRRDVLEADELPFLSDIPKDPLFKPTLVSSQLLFMFTEVNDVVLDPFSGLGSIPFVCEIFRRRWVSFEIDVARYEFSKRFIIDNML